MKQLLLRKSLIGLFIALGCCSVVNAQFVTHERLLSFEEKEVPSCIETTKGETALSGTHFKDGSHSLQWSFQPEGTLSFKKDLMFEPKDPTGKDLYLSACIVWIYNENPIDDVVRFEFLKDGKVCTSFPFGINFKGWRAAWVCYERDMGGTPEVGMNELRITAPQTQGKLYIDHLITASKVDARQQTPDFQVPFVNLGTKNHWLVIYEHSKLQPTIPLTAISDSQLADMQRIEKRFRDQLYTPAKLTDKRMDNLRKKFDYYQISYQDGQITGRPIFLVRAAEAYERMIDGWNKDMLTKLGYEMRPYFDLMKQVAFAYHDAKQPEVRQELRDMFMAMYDHITDQGVVYGSCWGNIHHYGYSVRSLYPAYFMMKDVLREEGKLTQAEQTLRWYAITNEIYPEPTETGIDMDTFNTQCPGRIASILIMEDTPEKLQYLKSFSRWIDFGCRPALGLSGSFKADGGAFHHRNNYPAYAVGGLGGATQMIYLLSRTGLAVSPEAHATVKNVLSTMSFYCNTQHFPLSMSGRHPDGKGKLVPMQFAMMAIAGTPDGKQEIDEDMATTYLRLVAGGGVKDKEAEYVPSFTNAEEGEMIQLFSDKGIKAAASPQGNMALPSGCLSVQRGDNWSAVVRGHSRYLWAAEHYLGANLYGRYLAHGSMQVLTAPEGEVITPATSGWQEAGFDWNRIPGTTTIHLPFDLLKAKVYNVDRFSGIEEMLYSDEAFAGPLSQGGTQGNFGMVLHEHDKYNGTHRARKSYHFLGDKIVCLGSNIENLNSEYPTETTLFQLAVTDEKGKNYWDNYQSNKNYWIDHLGTAYYTPQEVLFEKKFPQQSRAQKNGKETSGDWVSLIIDHGKAPVNASYEYAVLPKCSSDKLRKFAKKPTYQVVQHDRNAHIVHDKALGLTSYVLFETPTADFEGYGLVQRVDTACLLMVQHDKHHALLTVAQPDLALYSGPSDEAFDENGKRKERSIYSRPWINNDNGEIPVTVTLKGEWNVPEGADCTVVSVDKKQTILRFVCKGGVSKEVSLLK